MKRIISMFLVMTFLFGLFVPIVQAETPIDTNNETSIENGDLTIEGSNALGNLLADGISDNMEETQAEAESGYSVSDIVIEGNIATVTYESLENAMLVVALYTEDGLKMLNSAQTKVSSDSNEAVLEFEGDMPEYFLASAYLMDTYSLAPLCGAYETTLYTKGMRDLINSTVDDYDPDLVYNLDDDPTTNFVVFAENTKIIEYVEGVNIVVCADSENSKYIIDNIDENITSLKSGDIFSYSYNHDDIIVGKVAKIDITGTTATITTEKIELDEVFTHVKIEGTSDSRDIIVDDSIADGGVKYLGLVNEEVSTFAFSDEGSISAYHEFEIKKFKAEEDDEHIEASITFEGLVKLEIKVSIKYYISLKKQLVEFKATPTVKATISIKNKININSVLGYFAVSPVPGVYVGFEPELQCKIDVKAEIELVFTTTLGIKYDSSEGIVNLTKKPDVDLKTNIEGTIFIGIDFSPTAKILSEDIAELKLTAFVGGEFKAKVSGKNHETYDKDEPKYHECYECFALDAKFKAEISGEIKLMAAEWLTIKVEIGKWTVPLGDMYYSEDRDEFGKGKCPYYQYRVTVQVENRDGEVVKDATVNVNKQTMTLTTDENGIAVFYCYPQKVTLRAEYGDLYYEFDVDVKSDKKVLMTLLLSVNSGLDGPTGGSDGNVWGGDIDFGGILDYPDKDEITDNGSVVDSGKWGQDVSWTLYENGLLELSGTGDMENTYSSGLIPWCDYVNNITKVTIADTITSIGVFAFHGCNRLTEITIPASVTHIYAGAFSGCSRLTRIEIPNSVSSIDHDAFGNCTRLSKLIIPDSVTEIGTPLIPGCSLLKTLGPIGKGYNIEIGYRVFDSFFDSPFSNIFNSPNLTAVEIPYGVTTIDNYLFEGCGKLTNVLIPETVTKIGWDAFKGCDSLTSIVIPNSVTTIKERVFYSCGGLTSITLPNSVDKIENSTFQFCSNLTSITIPTSVKSIGGSAFDYCKSLTDVYYTGTKDQWKTITIGSSNKPLTNAIIHCTDGTIGDSVASGNYGDNLTWTLYNSGLLEISGSGDMDSDSVTSYDQIPWYNYKESITKVTIADTITNIGDFAFYGCSKLTSIAIPNSVTSIDMYAFSECTALNSISLPNGITNIENGAFMSCSALTSITIPDSVTKIGIGAFSQCSALKSITIPDGVTGIGYYTFYDCSALTTITLPDSIVSFGDAAFFGCSSLTSITLPDGLKTMGTSVFCGCSSLTTITIPNSVTSIGYGVFQSCTGLTNVKMSKGVTSIGDYAFKNCSNLNYIAIPNSVTSIGTDAFLGCNNLKSVGPLGGGYNVEIGWNSQIPSNAFNGVISIESVVIPEGITKIGTKAFYLCHINNIVISKTLNTVEKNVFTSCYNLVDVYYTGTQTEWKNITFEDGNGYITHAIVHCNYDPDNGKSQIVASGKLTDSVSWSLNTNGLLNITGSGTMPTVANSSSVPWNTYRTNIKSVYIGNKITSIGSYAFSDCNNLVSIYLPKSVASVGNSAFKNCNSLERIYYSGNNSSWSNITFGSSNNLNSKIEYHFNAKLSPEKATDVYMQNRSEWYINYNYMPSYGISYALIDLNFDGIIDLISDECNGGPLSSQWHELRYFTINPETLELTEFDITTENAFALTTRGLYGLYQLSNGEKAYYVSSVGCYASSTEGLLYLENNSVTAKYLFSEGTGYDGYTYVKFKRVKDNNGQWVDVSDEEYARLRSEFNSSVTSLNLRCGQFDAFDVAGVSYSEIYDIVLEAYMVFAYDNDITTANYTEQVSSVSITSAAEESEIMQLSAFESIPTTYTSIGGDYSTDITEEYTLKTASFTDLVPGQQYVLLSMMSLDAANPISPDNLLYIKQGTAADDGTLSFEYVQRIDTAVSYVILCGASDKDINDTEITFPEMVADGKLHVIDPEVVYGDKTLVEGKDYIITGRVDYTNPGEYTCYIQGINAYIGEVTCVYTVKCNHSYAATVTAPTCTEQGYTTYTCKCGDSYVVNYISAKGHSFGEWSVTTAPTCAVAGEEHRDCVDCDYFETRAVSAIDHSYSPVVTQPTCTEQGYTTHTCKCGNSYVDSYVNALGHSFGEWIITNPATETSTGLKERTCSACSLKEAVSIPKLDHVHSYTSTVTAPTCTSQGYTTYICKCGNSYVGNYVDATGIHDYSGTACSGCGIPCGMCGNNVTWIYDESSGELTVSGFGNMTNYSNSNYIPWKDYRSQIITVDIHIGVTSIGNYAFCDFTNITNIIIPRGVTSIGEWAFDYCNNLESITLPDSVTYIDNGAFYDCNNLKNITIPESVTSIGTYAFFGCDNLSTIYYGGSQTDWNAVTIREYNTTLLKANIIFAKHEHDYVATVTVPTCTEQGYTTYTCKCGDSYIGDYISAKEHSFGSWETVKNATCITEGTISRSCQMCGEYETRSVNALGHNFSSEWTVDIFPTIEATGQKSRHCLRCDAVTDVTIIEKLTIPNNALIVGKPQVAPDFNKPINSCDWGKPIASIDKNTANAVLVNYAGTAEDVSADIYFVSDGEYLYIGIVSADYDLCGNNTTYLGDGFQIRFSAGSEMNYTYPNFCDVYVTLNEDCKTVGSSSNVVAKNILYVDGKLHMKAKVALTDIGITGMAGKFVSFNMLRISGTPNQPYAGWLAWGPFFGVGHNYNSGITESNLLVLTDTVVTKSHIAITDEAVSPTCIETGLTEGKSCSDCGKIFVAQNIIRALGHVEVIDESIQPTCTETGLTEGSHCSACGDILIEQQTVSALGHSFGELNMTTDPTCTASGEKRRDCANCDHFETRMVAALGHDFSPEWTVDIEPTTTTPGQKSRHCSRCDVVTDVIEIAKKIEIIDSSKKFTDVASSSWAKAGIDYVVSYGYMNGTGNGTTFSPGGTMSRSMIVTVLYRIAGQPSHSGKNIFTDVEKGWYYDAVLWAYENGIVTGTSKTTFAPNGDVTREQMATFLYRFAKYMGYDTTAKADLKSFPDESCVGSWAYDALAWANAEGLITGAKESDGVTRLNPQGAATREQVATILMRFCQAYEE